MEREADCRLQISDQHTLGGGEGGGGGGAGAERVRSLRGQGQEPEGVLSL